MRQTAKTANGDPHAGRDFHAPGRNSAPESGRTAEWKWRQAFRSRQAAHQAHLQPATLVGQETKVGPQKARGPADGAARPVRRTALQLRSGVGNVCGVIGAAAAGEERIVIPCCQHWRAEGTNYRQHSNEES